MDGEIIIGTELDTMGFDKEIAALEEKLDEIKGTLQMADEDKTLFSTREIKNMEAEAEKLSRRIENLKEKQLKLDNAPKGEILKYLKNVGKGTENTIKKVGRWAVAIFGIRSAYMLVRRAMSTISEYNEQVKADLQYIQVALASILEPLIKRIISLVYTLLQYLQYIIYQWTGKNIFENANESLKKMNKGAKDLKKQLAGLDEINVLSDNQKAGTTAPSVDLSQVQGDVPKWIQWIADNGDLLEAIIGGMTGALIALKVFGLDPIKSLGIGLAVAGLIHAIKNLIKFIKNPNFKNFIGILEGIAVAVGGVAIAVAAWPVAIGAAVALAVIEIVKHFDKIKELFNKLIEWLDKNVLGGLRKLFGPLGDILYAPIKYFVELARNLFEKFYGGIKQVVEGIVKLFRGDFLGGLKDIFGGLANIMTAPLQAFVNAVKSVIPLVKNFFSQMFDYLGSIGSKAGQVIGGAFKSVINGVLSTIEKVLNTPINAINKLLTKINKVPGINLSKLSTINLPRLATGGIINQPGRGIPIGNAIAGENREGVLPLTDSRAMSELGQEIARYVNIRNFVDVNMDSRKINRITEESSNRQAILRNG